MININPISPETSGKLANMSFVCAVLVVTIHVTLTANGAARWINWFFSGAISNVAVPVFFAMSGYLLVDKYFKNGWYCEVVKRVKSLLVPYLLWGGLFVLLGLLIRGIIMGGCISVGDLFCNWLGLDWSKTPGLHPLWYIRNLFVLVALSPILIQWVCSFSWHGVLFMYVLLLLYYAGWRECLPVSVAEFFRIGFSLVGLVSFMTGVALRLFPYRIGRKFHALMFSILGTVSCLIFMLWKPGWGVVMCLLIPQAAVLLWFLTPSKRWAFAGYAFPIYLMHVFPLYCMGIFPNSFPCPTLWYGWLFQFAMALFTAIAATWMIRLFVPGFAKVAFGGRG